MQDDATPKLTTRASLPVDDKRFIPGTILAERYRIIHLLGKGGMGEVYRADDLKLGQPVALKFLPERHLSDSAALARFHREVRVARQISHRNVCRVYDICEVDSRLFLSMELIKGEELSSLLHRIDRFPPDKALTLARQICAGLAAAHESGILHRDLKPSNVMIDADGNARITDFGLAGLVEEFHDDEMGAGTPAYMSPEQLDGQPLTIRSDIYSLGLVLYELFTGKRAYHAPTLAELIKLRRSDTPPITPTSIVTDLDPLIEQVINRCLQKDPSQRPASALHVAAALPGGNLIAAALAAGGTPSPEMVAAAPKAGALRPLVALASFAAVVALLLFLLLSSRYTRAEQKIPFEKPPEVLAERAREIVASLGYHDVPKDQGTAFTLSPSFQQHVEESGYTTDWQLIRTGQPVFVYFWYWQAPRYLTAEGSAFALPTDQPPLTIAGLTNVTLDPRGRLLSFERVPQVDDAVSSASETDWSPLFSAAGLNSANYTHTDPQWIPPITADQHTAWKGPHVDHPQMSVHIEAASYKNRPVYFEIVFPWEKPPNQEEQPSMRGPGLGIILSITVASIVLLSLLGFRNLQLGRSNKPGAIKLAIFVFVVTTVGMLIGARHVPSLGDELAIVLLTTIVGFLLAALTWLYYIALEPHIRRKWPKLLISWSRLIAGNFRDPMVGRDLLIGGLLGLVQNSVVILGSLLSRWLAYPSVPLFGVEVFTLNGFRATLSVFLWNVTTSVSIGFGSLFLLLLLYIILRRKWVATGALFLTVLVIHLFSSPMNIPPFWVASVLISLCIVTVVVRFGLLATMAAPLFSFLTSMYPMPTDLSAWYAPSAVFSLAMVAGLAVYGFYTSLGGQRVFGSDLQASYVD